MTDGPASSPAELVEEIERLAAQLGTSDSAPARDAGGEVQAAMRVLKARIGIVALDVVQQAVQRDLARRELLRPRANWRPITWVCPLICPACGKMNVHRSHGGVGKCGDCGGTYPIITKILSPKQRQFLAEGKL